MKSKALMFPTDPLFNNIATKQHSVDVDANEREHRNMQHVFQFLTSSVLLAFELPIGFLKHYNVLAFQVLLCYENSFLSSAILNV